MADAQTAAGAPGAGATGALLELIGDTIGLLEIDEFRHGVLHALRRAVPAEWVAINDIGPDLDTILAIVDPPVSPALFAKFKRHAGENPLLQRYVSTHDGRAARFSDVVSADELHRLDIYREFYRPMGIESQIAFTLPSGAGRILAIALSRAHGDFTDTERELLNAARPYLIQAYANALRYTDLLAANGSTRVAEPAPEVKRLIAVGLTARQAHVLQLAATGVGDRDIAIHLQISPRTVEKHLEACYRTLAVTSRRRAVELAWATLGTAAETETIHRPDVVR